MDADARRPAPDRRRALRLLAAGGVAAALGAPVVAELVRRGRLRRVSLTHTRMGTPVTVTVVHEDGALARAMAEAPFAEIERLERILSGHRSESALSRLNRDGWLRPVPDDLARVVGAARRWARLSDGAFDPTVAPLLRLYATRAARGEGPPDPEDIARARTLVGWRQLVVEGDTLAFERPGVAVTLDGIAKGYVVDRAVAVLEAAGAGRVMVDAGGDMASAAGLDGEPWRVAIQHPRDPRGTLGVVKLAGGCVATSGDYMQAFTPDRSLHHVLDPRTGRSPLACASATVLAATAMDADALSTATLVLGPERGLALLDEVDGVEGMVVTKAGEVRATAGFRTVPA